MSGYRYRAERLTPIGTDPCNTMTTAIYADAVGAEEKDIARRMWG